MLAGRDILLDTSALVGRLDQRDQWHEKSRAVDVGIWERCLTTEAVLVEATHLIARVGEDRSVPLSFLLSLDIPIMAVHRPLHEDCLVLMRRYADAPMDYADATLVALAARLKLTRVFTFDRRGFRQYRAGAEPFDVVP